MSNSSSLSKEQPHIAAAEPGQVKEPTKRKRGLAGNPDPNAEVISLTAEELLATHRFQCKMCGKGLKREQNLQLHMRGHNLPWELKKNEPDGNGKAVSKKNRVYVCPEPTCIHHLPERALGDLTGIKKHYRRKHGEKNFKCEKCGKDYAVDSDYKAHIKICGTKSYKCECTTKFARRDSFLAHKKFCQAYLAVETAKHILSNDQEQAIPPTPPINPESHFFQYPCSSTSQNPNRNPNPMSPVQDPNPSLNSLQNLPLSYPPPTANLTPNGQLESVIFGQMDHMGPVFMHNEGVSSLTRDLLNLRGESSNNNQNAGEYAQLSMNMEGLLNCTRGNMEPRNPIDHGGELVRPSGPTTGNGGVGDYNQYAAAFKLWE